MVIRTSYPQVSGERQGSDFTFGVSDETFPKGFGEKAVSPINVSNEFFPYSSPPKKNPQRC